PPNAPATSCTDTLSLHDALPILPAAAWSCANACREGGACAASASHPRRPESAPDTVGSAPQGVAGVATLSNAFRRLRVGSATRADRKSTRLNSSHVKISYAVFCL